MSNRSVIAIFIIGVSLLLAAFWAGLKVTREPAILTQVNANTIASSHNSEAGSNEGATNGSGFVVLVGTFGSAEKADQLTAELRRKSYKSAYTQAPLRADETLYRVFIGPYEKSEADRVANELTAEGRKGVMIRPQN